MKRVVKYLIFIILCNFVFLTINAKELELKSKNVVLYNMNEDNLIYEKNKDEVISIASLTKIMTSIVAIENISDLNKEVVVSNDAFSNTYMLALAGFKVGDKVTINDLLYGCLLPSGAEACNELAIRTSGNINNHVKKMNEKAKELGLKNTHFVNVTGMDTTSHNSTVEEVSKILKYALKNEEFKRVFTTKEYKTTNNIILKSTLKKTSEKYNLSTDFITGSKTGHTTNAGLCMASITNLSDVDYLLVTCRAPSMEGVPYNVTEAVKIYNYYDENYGYIDLVKKGDKITSINIKDGKEEKYDIKAPKTISKYLEKSIKNNISLEYNGIKTITKKIKKGDKLGIVYIKNNDKTIDKFNVYLDEKIKYKFFTTKNIAILSSLLIIIILMINLLKGSKKSKRRRKRRKR